MNLSEAEKDFEINVKKKNFILNTRLSQGFPLRDLSEAGTGRVVIRESYTWAEPGNRNSEKTQFLLYSNRHHFQGQTMCQTYAKRFSSSRAHL